jgi:hypothetical protein
LLGIRPLLSFAAQGRQGQAALIAEVLQMC